MEVVSLDRDIENEIIEFVYVIFDIESLIVTVSIDGYKIDVTFDSPVGYRVLDEGDLLEFWPECSTSNGWLYEIKSGGWLEQESNRTGFISAHNSEVFEYFVIGTNYCVSVFGWEAPSIAESTR